jgi:hypothetical protein
MAYRLESSFLPSEIEPSCRRRRRWPCRLLFLPPREWNRSRARRLWASRGSGHLDFSLVEVGAVGCGGGGGVSGEAGAGAPPVSGELVFPRGANAVLDSGHPPRLSGRRRPLAASHPSMAVWPAVLPGATGAAGLERPAVAAQRAPQRICGGAETWAIRSVAGWRGCAAPPPPPGRHHTAATAQTAGQRIQPVRRSKIPSSRGCSHAQPAFGRRGR